MEIPQPTPEHEWLLQLVGDWEFESECSMGPDKPPLKTSGKQTKRAFDAMMTMKKIEIGAIEAAFKGK